MPISTGLNLLRYLPIPTGRNYVLGSLFLLTTVAYHSYRVVSKDGGKSALINNDDGKEDGNNTEAYDNFRRNAEGYPLPVQMLIFALTDQFSVWVCRFFSFRN